MGEIKPIQEWIKIIEDSSRNSEMISRKERYILYLRNQFWWQKLVCRVFGKISI